METKCLPSGKVGRWLLASVVVLVVGLGGLAACGGTEAATTGTGVASTTTVSTTTTTTIPSTIATVPLATTTTVAAPTTTQAGPEIEIIRDVPYLAQQREGWDPPLFDIYAPKQAGPWPLVVMLHGAGANKGYSYYPDWATKVAQRGAVVFVPDWGIVINKFGMFGPVALTPEELRAALPVEIGDVAAIIRFARATGVRYGGDPKNLTLFGHSGGANQALMEPLSGASASEGALAGAGSSIPERAVVFDADYLLAGTSLWDGVLAGEPSIMQLITPWPSLGRRVDFPITIIGSGDPGLSRELGDPWAEDSWLVVRDPSGDIRRGLEELGAFEGDRITNESIEQLLVERLKADGDKVTYVRLTDSSHENLGPEGMESLLDALVPTPQK